VLIANDYLIAGIPEQEWLCDRLWQSLDARACHLAALYHGIAGIEGQPSLA
jgi:hypothetical protein